MNRFRLYFIPIFALCLVGGGIAYFVKASSHGEDRSLREPSSNAGTQIEHTLSDLAHSVGIYDIMDWFGLFKNDEWPPYHQHSFWHRILGSENLSGDTSVQERCRIGAVRGNVDAQYLLGSTLRSLIDAGKKNAEGLVWLHLAAARGHAKAQAELGDIYYFGRRDLEKNEALGIDFWQRAAAGGDSQTQLMLGRLLYYGDGMDMDKVRGLDLMERAAASGGIHAQRAVGRILCAHRGMVENEARGLEYLERSSSWALLGEIYSEGFGVEKNEAHGFKLLKRAVNGGNCADKTRYLYGISLYFGRGVEKNETKALKYLDWAASSDARAKDFLHEHSLYGWRKKNAALGIDLLHSTAASGDCAAQYKLGKMIYYGLGLEKKQAAGIELMQSAALNGYLPAQSFLGILLYDDLDIKNQVLGLDCLRRASARGDARAQYHLAILLSSPPSPWYDTHLSYSSLCIEKNTEESLAWMERAAASGVEEAQEYMEAIIRDRRCSSLLGYVSCRKDGQKWCESAATKGNLEAQYILGRILYEGYHMKKNQARGLELMERAATGGLVSAQDWLGKINCEGLGMEKNEARGLAWMERAAANGLDYTQYELNRILYKAADEGEGRGEAKIQANALAWMESLAASGYAAAQTKLGEIYCEGKVVDKNAAQGLEWLNRAADSGYFPAQFYLNETHPQGLK